MTREEAKEKWKIIKAYSEGKTIEFFGASGEWFEVQDGFELPINEKLRIKPNKSNKIEPYKASEEFWKKNQGEERNETVDL